MRVTRSSLPATAPDSHEPTVVHAPMPKTTERGIATATHRHRATAPPHVVAEQQRGQRGVSARPVWPPSSDSGGKASDGSVELDAAVASRHVGLGQLGSARSARTVAEEPVGFDGEGQPPERRRHRTDGIHILGIGSTVDRRLEGGGRSLDLEPNVGAQPIVVGLGVAGQQRVPGQAGVTQSGQDHPAPSALTGACPTDEEGHGHHDDGEDEHHDEGDQSPGRALRMVVMGHRRRRRGGRGPGCRARMGRVRRRGG